MVSQNQIGFSGGVFYKDSANLDAFGRLRVSMPYSLFDAHNEFGLDTYSIFDATANGTLIARGFNESVSSNGNSVGPVDSASRICPVTVSSTDTHYAILQSAKYLQYQPGKSHMVFVTGVFAAGANYTAYFCLRSSVSGSVVDTEVAQSSWNIDKLDGTGASGITLDLTKIQILIIDAQMLYAGRIRFGFDIDGIIIYAHEMLIANNQSARTLQLYDLPIRVEGRTQGAATNFIAGYFDSGNGCFLKTSRATLGGTVNFNCATVISEGGQDVLGLPRSAARQTKIGVTTRRPIMTIRPKQTFNGYRNNAIISLLSGIFRATGNDGFFEVVIGGALTGASFASLSTASTAEIDTAATAISGGIVIASAFCEATGANSGSPVTLDITGDVWLYQIDNLTPYQDTVSIVSTSLSGTADCSCILNFAERIT